MVADIGEGGCLLVPDIGKGCCGHWCCVLPVGC